VHDADGKRWVIPGDSPPSSRRPISLLGRGSQCINSGGEKIFPEEVESALKAHPAVFDAIVVGVPDERWGQRVAAVVAPARARPRPSRVRSRPPKIAGYKVPRELHLVEAVTRSPSGKADYRWAKSVATGES
jgi:acyl-CoA synthetase (AMP-forming)/AMP-acid ligase II